MFVKYTIHMQLCGCVYVCVCTLLSDAFSTVGYSSTKGKQGQRKIEKGINGEERFEEIPMKLVNLSVAIDRSRWHFNVQTERNGTQ